MPVAKKWSKMNRANIKRQVPAKRGIYERTSFGKKRALYIGKSDNLQRRLLEHLDDRQPNRFRYKPAGWLSSPASMERVAFDQYEDKYGGTPPWNKQDPRSGWF